MLLCMRTTIEVNDELFRQVRRRAADEGLTLRELVEQALRAHLGQRRRGARYSLSWKPVRGQVRPGVQLDDRDALFDVMEGRR